MSTLSLTSKILAFEDRAASSNPLKTPINNTSSLTGIPVSRPATEPVRVEPGATLEVTDASRATSIDGTSAFSLAASLLEAGRYRITNTGGTAPEFRTARTITVSGIVLTIVITANLAAQVTAASGTPFANIQSGDIVSLPGPTTGDASTPFDPQNQGSWVALTATDTVLTMARATGTTFSGIGEVVTPSANTQLQAFTTAGVQVGDTVELVSGFADTALRSYPILAVNPSWIEFGYSGPLGAESGIVPTATGMLVYQSAKRWIGLETDQEIVVRVNGDTSDNTKATPWVAGGVFVGEYRKTGIVWKLVFVNHGTSAANVMFWSVE